MIELNQISIHAGGFQLQDLSMRIETGEYLVLMGRTGSGKTTLLEAICGLRLIHAGSLRIDDRDITRLRPAERRIGYVPQDGALFPTLPVAEQLAFALRIRNFGAEPIKSRVTELAEQLHLTELLHRLPHQLSGGERQRVALGRALAFTPDLLCLDEPLSALDDASRAEIRNTLAKLHVATGLTTLHITHHRDDATHLADRILTLRDGQLHAVN